MKILNRRKGKCFAGILFMIALLLTVCVSSAKAADGENEGQGRAERRLAALDQTVADMLDALERGDYDGFSAHYMPGKRHELSDGSASAALSKAQFDAVRARFLQNGRRLASVERISNSAGGDRQDAEYRLEFENRDIVAHLHILGGRDAIERGVVDFSLRWIQRGRLEEAERAAEKLIGALCGGDYAAFTDGFSPMLRQKYTPEEFQYLRKHLLAEKGDYRGRVTKNFSKDEKRRTIWVMSRLAFANDSEGQEPVYLYVEISDTGAPEVTQARIEWLPDFEKRRMERLADVAIAAFLNEGDDEKFLACFTPELEAELPREQLKELRQKLLEIVGKCRAQSFLFMRLEWLSADGEIDWLKERRIFVYRLQCEKKDTVLLHLMANREGERFYLRGFQFQIPFVTEHIGDVYD